MGFWSTVGDIAKGAAANLSAATKEAEIIAEDYRRENDDFLKRKIKNGSLAQKLAAAKVLKERGHGNQS